MRLAQASPPNTTWCTYDQSRVCVALLAVWSGTSGLSSRVCSCSYSADRQLALGPPPPTASGAILREIALPHEVNVIVNDAPYVSSSRAFHPP